MPRPYGATEHVLRSVRDDILHGRYRAGDRLPSERELAERLAVSRPAVREALRSLAELRILEIAPGGARVLQIQEASLDLVGHLLELHEIPNAELVDQVLEAHAFLFSACVQMTVHRAPDAILERARELLRLAEGATAGGPESEARDAYFEHLHELVQLFVDASGNLILRMMRHGLKIQFWDRLERLPEFSMRLPAELLRPMIARLDAAFATRDADAAGRLVLEMMALHREQARKALSLLGEDADSGEPAVLHDLLRALHVPPPAPDGGAS